MNDYEINDRLVFMIINSSKLLTKKINIKFATYTTQLNPEQLAILYFIFRNSNRKTIQNNIAEFLDKKKSAITKTIDILEEKEYLKRHSVINDRRKNAIVLTKSGNNIGNNIHRILIEEENTITKGIKKNDLAICMKVLSEIQTNCKI